MTFAGNWIIQDRVFGFLLRVNEFVKFYVLGIVVMIWS